MGHRGKIVHHDPAVAGDAAGDGRAERDRLLVHLLEHEMVVAALLGGLQRPGDRGDDPFARRAVDAGDLDARGMEVDHVALLEEDHLVRVGEDGRDVAGQERLAVADPDDERHVHPGADEPVGLAPVHDRQGVGALDEAERGAGGLRDVAGVGLLDEVGERLRVGLGGELVTALLEPVPELAEVLDDPVVDDRDLAGAVDVGVGVQVVRPAVGRPAGVRQPDRRVRRPVGDRRLEVGQLAGPLLDEQVAVLVDERDPGRVVAAVLEALQALDEDGARLTRTGVADDAAHAGRVSSRPRDGTPGAGSV